MVVFDVDVAVVAVVVTGFNAFATKMPLKCALEFGKKANPLKQQLYTNHEPAARIEFLAGLP